MTEASEGSLPAMAAALSPTCASRNVGKAEEGPGKGLVTVLAIPNVFTQLYGVA